MSSEPLKGFLYTWRWRIVFALALVIRLIYLIQYSSSPFYIVPMRDAGEYHRIALALAQGNLDQALIWRAPLYPLFLGIVYMIFGAHPLPIRLIQILLGVFTCILTGKIAERIFDWRAGLAAGMLCALAGLMIYFDLELLPTSLAVFLYTATFYQVIHLSYEETTHPKRWILAGLTAGLGALVRPTILPIMMLVLLWLWWQKSGIKKIASYSAGLAFPLLLSLFIHVLSGSGPLLISAQGGVNFYIGNHRQSQGVTADFPGKGHGWTWDGIKGTAEQHLQKQLTLSEVDKFYWEMGKKEIVDHPKSWQKLMRRKLLLFWNHVEISSNRDLYYHWRNYPFVGWLSYIGFPWLLPLAFAGIVMSWRFPTIRLLTGYLFIYWLLTSFFFVNARFRHPLLPVLIILAAGAVWGVNRWSRGDESKQTKALVLPAIALLIGLILPWSASSGIPTDRYDYGLFTEGQAWERLGDVNRAEKLYHEAISFNPRAPYIYYTLGNIYFKQDRFKLASDYYAKETDIQPNYGPAWNQRGLADLETGDDNQALNHFLQALNVDPNMSEARRNAARVWGQKALIAAEDGYWDLSGEMVQEALKLEQQDPLYRTLRLEVLMNLGRTDGIVDSLDAILKEYPGFIPARELLNALN